MLNIKKNVKLNGQSFIQEGENKVMVVSMNATLNSDGILSVSKTTVRPDIYAEHKAAVQKDMKDFEQAAYELEYTGTDTE